MVTFEELPHHDARRDEDDGRGAAITLLLLGIFSVVMALLVASTAAWR